MDSPTSWDSIFAVAVVAMFAYTLKVIYLRASRENDIKDKIILPLQPKIGGVKAHTLPRYSYPKN